MVTHKQLTKVRIKMATFKYFSGDVELVCTKPVDNNMFANIGGVRSKHNCYDGYSSIVGATTIHSDVNKVWLPVTRKIEYKSRPSLHKCDARCQNSTGHVCECSCGGKYHGINA